MGQEDLRFTAIIVSHEIPEIFGVADKVGMLSDGVMAQIGTAEEIKNSQVPEVMRFVRGISEEVSVGGKA